MSIQDLLKKPGTSAPVTAKQIEVAEPVVSAPAKSGLKLNIGQSKPSADQPATRTMQGVTNQVASTQSIADYKMKLPGSPAQRPTPTAPPVDPFAESADPFADINAAFETATAASSGSLIDEVNVSNYHYAQQAESCDDQHAVSFFTLMHELVNGFHRQEINKQMVTIMQHLADHPQLKNILKPEDIGHMVKALRESYGVAFTNKQQAKSKSSDRKKKDNEVLDELAGLGF